MRIKINEDFEEKFQDEFIKGFTGRQVLIIVLAFGSAIAVAICAWHFAKVPVDITVYLGIPVMIPILGLGFFRYQKMSVFGLIKAMLYTHKTKVLTYEAEELKETDRHVFKMEHEKKGGKK